jgi:hypothetical protein
MIPEKQLHDIIETHSKNISELHIYRKEDRRLIEKHEDQIHVLDNTMTELRERFGLVATHADIRELHEKIDSSINNLLKDALNAVPGKIGLAFTGLMSLVAIISLIISLTKHL